MLCPRCGTANPDSSEFCTNCGQALPDGDTLQRPQFDEPKWGEDSVPDWLLDQQENLPEELRDPDIDQMVRQRALASVQSTALPATERDEGASVQETEVGPEEEAESAEWFDEALFPMDEGPPPLEEAPATSQEAVEESEAWLDTLLSSEEDVSASAVDATEASQDTGAGVLAGETEDEASDWLDDLRGSIDEVTVRRGIVIQPTGDREIPDQQLQESFDVGIAESDAIPSATSKTEVLPQIQESTSSSVEEHAPPDWLPTVQPSRGLEEEAPDSAEMGLPAEVPEWLRSITEPYSQTTEAMSLDEAAVPDWLRAEPEEESGLHEETQSAPTETAAVAGRAVDADMPEWLLTLEGVGRPLEADDVAADSDDTLYPEIGTGPLELPDWLRAAEEAHSSSEEDLQGQQITEDETVASPVAEEIATEPQHSEIPEEIPGEAETTPSSQTLPVASEGPPPITAEAEVAEIAEAATTEPDHPETAEERPVAGEEDEEDTSSQAPQEDLTEPAETVSAAVGLAGVAALAEQPSDSGGEIPEWIQELAEQIREGPPPAAGEDEASLLEGAEVGGPAYLSHTTPGEAPGDASETPEWLRDLRDQEPLDDMAPPTWLTEPEAESQPDLPGEEIPHMQEETPGWIAGPSPADRDSTPEDLPEWLHDLDTAEEELSQETPESEVEEVPSWLKRMSVPEASDARAQTTHAEEVAIVKAGDELSEGRSVPSEQPTVGAPILPLLSESSHAESAPTEAMDSVSRQEVATALTTDESLQELQGKESAILAGIGAALSVEPAIFAVKPSQQLMPQSAPEETEQARILQEIASQPLVPGSSVIGRKRSHLWGTLGRIIIYLLIIAAVVVPLYWQGALQIGFISEYNIPISSQTQNVYEQINTVPEQSLALLVVDYEPSLAEELNTQARTLLQNLMERQLKILLVSTTLTGPQVMQDIMEELVKQTDSNYEYGEDYLNLGYLPGQEASLLLFGQSPLAAVRVDFRDGENISSYPIAADLQDVPQEGLGQVIPLIINLTGNQENLRTWIEQVLAVNDNVTMIAGVSAGLEPYAYPYLESGQLAGLLSGLTGAAEYESLTEKPGRAIRSMDSQIAVHLLIVVLIVLGNVGYVLKRIVTGR